MHFHTKTFLTVAFLLLSLGLWAQESDHANDSALLARLSYQRSGVVAQADGVRHVCVAITRDGEYRIVRTGPLGLTDRRHGKMPKEQLEQLTKLLASPEFRAVSRDHVGLIREDAESFGAEIPGPVREHADGTRQWIERDAWRLQWLNADGESPFPSSVAKVVDWLQHFQPTDGKSFLYAEFPDVCPSVGPRLLQPTMAENQQP